MRTCCAFLLLSFASIPLLADVSVRECILFAEGIRTDRAWLLPASSGWKDVGSVRFNFASPSDIIVQASMFFSEGNTPNKRVEYQVLLDGVAKTQFIRATPDAYPTTQVSRTFMQDVLAGEHTITIRANNMSGVPVYYLGFWISPLLVDSTETMVKATNATAISAGSTWTTLASVTIAPPSDRMLLLSGYISYDSGTPKNRIEYRFLANGTVLRTFVDSVPDSFTDSMHMGYIFKSPVAGQNTITLEARTPAGAATPISIRSLFAQTMPKFTVFEASGSNLSFPNDDQYRAMAATGFQSIAPISSGDKGSGSSSVHSSDGWGFGHLTYTGSLSSEVQVRFWLAPESGGSFPSEVGASDVHPTARVKLEAAASDWEQLGLQLSPTRYKMEMQAVGLCQPVSSNISISEAHFQVMVTPDSTSYSNASCSSAPQACCANHYPDCTVYTCTASGQLAVANVPLRSCF